MTGFVLSPAARADIGQIWDYSAERWGADQAGRNVLGIRDACRDLVAGRMRRRAADDVRAGYRKAAVGSHVLFYRVREDGVLDIVRILHRRMDVPRHL